MAQPSAEVRFLAVFARSYGHLEHLVRVELTRRSLLAERPVLAHHLAVLVRERTEHQRDVTGLEPGTLDRLDAERMALLGLLGADITAAKLHHERSNGVELCSFIVFSSQGLWVPGAGFVMGVGAIGRLPREMPAWD